MFAAMMKFLMAPADEGTNSEWGAGGGGADRTRERGNVRVCVCVCVCVCVLWWVQSEYDDVLLGAGR